MAAIEGIAKNTELRKRIFFSLAMLAVYRLGVHIPTPGLDAANVFRFFQSQGGIFGLLNMFTGGALNQASIFGLGIMPYISSSIIFQLLVAVIPHLEQLNKEGEQGRKKIQQYTRYGTVVLAVIQGYAISTYLMGSQTPDGRPLIISDSVGFIPFRLMTILTLTSGTCFIMWLGEQISERGLGEGASLIIFAGIVAGIPTGGYKLFELVINGQFNGLLAIALLAIMVAIVAAIIFLEVGQRRIPIHFSQRGGKTQGMMQQASHLPLKLNMAGVIPVIFASSLLVFPATLSQFTQNAYLKSLQDNLSPTGALYNIIFVALIAFFSFFYVEIAHYLNPNNIADNLKKGGKFIPGIRAGKSTADYIGKVMNRLTVGGVVYLSALCVLPTLLIDRLNTPFYFGGTSILIAVGVALNTTQQIQSYLLTQKYEGFMRGVKMRSRRVQY